MKEADRLIATAVIAPGPNMVEDLFSEPIRPPPISWATFFVRLLLYSIFSCIGIPVMIYLSITKWPIISSIYRKMIVPSIKSTPSYKDPSMLARLWKSTIGKLYTSAVEYQNQEGYCCPATQRCILKSIPGMNITALSPQKRGPATIQKFAVTLDEQSQGLTKSHIVLGSAGYDEFISTLKKSNDPKFRVAANFLRSSLFGIKEPTFVPINWILALFGGHFSPVVGYFEDVNLVAIFDVNHTYSTFFVTPERFYDAIHTFDVTSGKARGLVVAECV